MEVSNKIVFIEVPKTGGGVFGRALSAAADSNGRAVANASRELAAAEREDSRQVVSGCVKQTCLRFCTHLFSKNVAERENMIANNK